MHKQSRNVTGIVILAMVVGAWALVWFQQRAIIDWFRLRGYTAPTVIVHLSVDTTMTPQATHDFYVNHPDLETATTFNIQCPAGSEQTIVLGCYQSNQKGIFLYNVTDTRLNGVEQVTAAHEMLHAAYDRLNDQERNYIDGLLQDYYNNGLRDKRVLDVIAAYKKSEPNDVVNEMHSVFGTEVANLPLALETYYKQYFIDRAKVVAYAAIYQSEFTSRQSQVTQYDAQLKQLKATYTANEADLQRLNIELQTLQSELNAKKQRGQFEAYNAAVPAYNAKADAFNVEISATKIVIAQYNQIVTARNAIAVEEQQLVQALNSQLAPIATQ